MFNLFRVEGPAVISFSGGRSSGLMLYKILEAWDGKLPEDVVVCFANTGKEMNETLDFVNECSVTWRVPIVWLEYQKMPEPKDRWKIVTYETASRNGEPFAANIDVKQYLPNPVTRFCTSELKVTAMHRYLVHTFGWEAWTSVVGIRADEPRRVAKLSIPNRDRAERIAPLAQAGISAADVGRFWENHSFDLRLPNHKGITRHGNCDLCFLKGAAQIMSLIREQPSRATWWMEQEKRLIGKSRTTPAAATFRSDRPTYKQMYEMAMAHDEMFSFDDTGLQDCSCTD